jgi:hypothetical protein
MELELAVQVFVIVKGFIDAKDDRGHTLYGTLLGVVSRRDTKYLSVMFSREESSKALGWSELLFLHNEKEKESDRDPVITHHEEEIYNYLERSFVLNGVAKNHNTKQVEQAISRYCLESLHLKAVSFIEYTDATEADLLMFEKTKKASPQDSPQPDTDAGKNPSAEKQTEQEPDGESGAKNKEEFVLRCDPILDPVNGVAMNEISVGDQVLGKLPEDSVFFKLLAKNISKFDGIVTAQVTGILMNELGTATISLDLSDGVAGVMKLSGKVKIKTVPRTDSKTGGGSILSRFRISELPFEIVLGIAGFIIMITGIIILFYIFG